MLGVYRTASYWQVTARVLLCDTPASFSTRLHSCPVTFLLRATLDHLEAATVRLGPVNGSRRLHTARALMPPACPIAYELVLIGRLPSPPVPLGPL
jgi:hypothetical protein